MNNKIITFDIKTLLINGLYYPFSIGIYDGLNFKYFYLDSFTDNSNINLGCKLLMEGAIAYLLNIKDIQKHIIYVHNLSKFDSIFILKYTSTRNHKICFHNNNIYKIKLYNKLTFHDSLKIICRS
jgi:DNA polymerase type B, organellar and viral